MGKTFFKKSGMSYELRATSYQLSATKKAFTLFELLVVMGIIVLIVTIGFSANGYILIDTSLNTKTHEIVENFKLAQTRALSHFQNSSWGMYFDLNGANNDRFILFKGTSYVARDTAYDLVAELPPTLTFSSIALTGGGSEVVFDKIGKTIQDGSITLLANNDATKVITINNLGAIFISTLQPMKIASGSYTGNGLAGRTITSVGFQPDIVIIKGDNLESAVIHTSNMSDDASKKMTGGGSLLPNIIKTLDGDGFTIGSDSKVNTNNIKYYWTAFKQGNGNFKLGSYIGNGTSQNISGVGFQPEYVMVLPANTSYPISRSANMDSKSYLFEGDLGETTRITGFLADGFSVGNGFSVNMNGVQYYYAAWNVSAKHIQTGSYIGNSSSGRQILGVGFQPKYLIIIPDAYGGSSHRSSAVTSEPSLYFSPFMSENNAIQALLTDGFQLGSHGRVNGNGTRYYWVAF